MLGDVTIVVPNNPASLSIKCTGSRVLARALNGQPRPHEGF